MKQRLLFSLLSLACLGGAGAAVQKFRSVLHFYPVQQTAQTLLREEETASRLHQDAVLKTLHAYRPTPQTLATLPASVAADYGYLSIKAALWQNPETLAGRVYALQAKPLLEQALSNHPADTFSWSRLAFSKQYIGKKQAESYPAWRMSIVSAPFEPKLLLWQVSFPLQDYELLSSADQTLLQQQTLHAWQYSKWRTVQLLATVNRPELLRPSLEKDPDGLEEFDKSYRYFLSVKQGEN